MPTTPVTLLERLRVAPDQEAWTRFVDLYTPLLLSWAYRLGLRAPEAADLVQDVFTHLLTRIPGFVYDRSRSFRGWLRTVTHNLWKNQQARRRPSLTGTGELDQVAAPELEAFWEVEYRQRLVTRARELVMSQYQPTTWRACWEVVVNGRSAEEVGEELGLSPEAVRAAKYRVLNRLRAELEGLLD